MPDSVSSCPEEKIFPRVLQELVSNPSLRVAESTHLPNNFTFISRAFSGLATVITYDVYLLPVLILKNI